MSTTTDPTREYALLLLRQHVLDPRAENESPELDEICAAMDAPWSRMNGRQRERMRGLSEDLYTLADGRHGMAMGEEELVRWQTEGQAAFGVDDPDAQLAHLRKPFPRGFPAAAIPSLQARCWFRLGLPEVAVVFLGEASKTLPAAKAAAMGYLRQIGRTREASELAKQLLADPQAKPPARYLAASTLFLLASELDQAAFLDILKSLVAPLRRVIEAEQKLPPSSREMPQLEIMATRVLALVLSHLDRREEVRQLCNHMLSDYPNDAALLIARALINLKDGDRQAAESDFTAAVAAGAQESLPYAAMAWFRVAEGRYAEVLALAHHALLFSNTPEQTKAWLAELSGIALAELHQPLQRVEEAFAQALALDPENSTRIEQNRQMAIKRLASHNTSGNGGNWQLPALEAALARLRAEPPQLPLPNEVQIQKEDFSELVAAPT